MRQFDTLCVATRPTSMGRYGGAADGWRQRNETIVTCARQALASGFDRAGRRAVVDAIARRNADTMTPVRQAPAVTRIGWCNRTAETVASGSLDLQGKPRLAELLLARQQH